MLKLEPVALELLEYKIQDVKAARQVKGGLASVWDLYNHLSKATVLSDIERGRVEVAGKVLKRFSETPRSTKSMTQTLEALVLEDSTVSVSLKLAPNATYSPGFSDESPVLEMDVEVLEEQAVLQRLAKRVWWHDMDAVMHEFAVQCRAEKDRVTARLLYALSLNLTRCLGAQDSLDVDLTHFRVEDAVPERGDPLVSLNDLDVLSDLVRDLVETILALGDASGRYASLGLPRGQALGFVKRLALALAHDPYGGDRSPVAPRRPNSEQLRLALSELAKEPLREEQKQLQHKTLSERLRITTAYEQQQRQAFQQDVHRFSDAAHTFFDRLERYLPSRVGGAAGEPQLRGGVLFAVNPALRVANVAADAAAVTIHLKGPTRFVLAGLELAISGGRTPSVYVDGQDHLLQPRLRLRAQGREIIAIYENAYLHLKVQAEERSLAASTAEALAVYFVLSSPYKKELLRVLRAAANVATGEPKDLVAQALLRLRELSSRAPDRRQALTGLVQGASRAVSATLPTAVVTTLVGRFLSAMTAAPDDLDTVLTAADGAELSRHRLTGEPLSLNIADQPLTVREYRGRSKEGWQSVAVVLPDRTASSFNHYLVQPFSDGTLLCVRAAEDLLCLYFAGVALEV